MPERHEVLALEHGHQTESTSDHAAVAGRHAVVELLRGRALLEEGRFAGLERGLLRGLARLGLGLLRGLGGLALVLLVHLGDDRGDREGSPLQDAAALRTQTHLGQVLLGHEPHAQQPLHRPVGADPHLLGRGRGRALATAAGALEVPGRTLFGLGLGLGGLGRLARGRGAFLRLLPAQGLPRALARPLRLGLDHRLELGQLAGHALAALDERLQAGLGVVVQLVRRGCGRGQNRGHDLGDDLGRGAAEPLAPVDPGRLGLADGLGQDGEVVDPESSTGAD